MGYPLLFCGLGVLGVALVYPLVGLMVYGLTRAAHSSILFDASFWRLASFTYGQALISTVLAAVVGGGLALAYTDWGLVYRRAIWTLSLVYFFLPSVLIVGAVVSLWGTAGLLGWLGTALNLRVSLYGWFGILMAHTLMNFPLFFRNVGLALRELGRAEEMAALSLGAGRWRVWCEITCRKLMPMTLRTGLISFVFCSSSFLVVLLLGGRPSFTTIEVAIYQAVRVEYDPHLAAQLALFQLAVAAAIFGLLCLVPCIETGDSMFWMPIYGFRGPVIRKAAFVGVFGLVALFVIAPLCLFLWEGIGAGSLDTMIMLVAPVVGSIKLAIAASVLATLLASLSVACCFVGPAWIRSVVEFLSALPVVISTTLISLSWMVVYRDLFFSVRGNILVIALIQAIGVLPVVYRILNDSVERIPKRHIETARSLGASPIQIVRLVVAPLVRPSIATVVTVAAGFSMGEISTLLMLMDERITTLPLVLYRLMAQYRFAESGFVGAVLLVLVSSLAYLSSRGDRWHLR